MLSMTQNTYFSLKFNIKFKDFSYMTQHSVLRYKKAIPDQVGNDMQKAGMTSDGHNSSIKNTLPRGKVHSE